MASEIIPPSLAPSFLRRPRVQQIYDESTEELTQAERVVKKFGGVPQLLRALKNVGKSRSKATIYKWLYPKEKKGRGGLIPTSAWPDILFAARMEGIHLSDSDFDPRHTVTRTRKISELKVDGVCRPYISRAVIKAEQREKERRARNRAQRKAREARKQLREILE